MVQSAADDYNGSITCNLSAQLTQMRSATRPTFCGLHDPLITCAWISSRSRAISGCAQRRSPAARQLELTVLPRVSPRIVRDGVWSLLPGQRRWSSCCTSTSFTGWAPFTVLPVLLPLGSNGVKGRKKGCSREVCIPHEFSVSKGRWDRNRTCNLRLWSLLPSVQQRSGTYLNGLEMGHFAGDKYVDVRQRSPALGSS